LNPRVEGELGGTKNLPYSGAVINSTIPPITAPNRLLRKKERKASVCIKMITEKEAAALAYKLYYLLLFDKHCR
jgi:hypothetical protein